MKCLLRFAMTEAMRAGNWLPGKTRDQRARRSGRTGAEAVLDVCERKTYDYRTENVRYDPEVHMTETESKIRTELEKFWDELAIPSGPGGATTVDELLGPLESMTAVEVLAILDEIVGFELPSSVIQAGGYETKDEFLDKLSAQVMDRVAKKAAAKV